MIKNLFRIYMNLQIKSAKQKKCLKNGKFLQEFMKKKNKYKQGA